MVRILSHSVSVAYDGSCGFCANALNILKRLDLLNKIHLVDYRNEEMVHAKFPNSDIVDLEKAMHVVTSDGRIYSGFFAVRRTLASTPLSLLSLLLYLPGLSIAGTYFYNWFARNRERLAHSNYSCFEKNA